MYVWAWMSVPAINLIQIWESAFPQMSTKTRRWHGRRAEALRRFPCPWGQGSRSTLSRPWESKDRNKADHSWRWRPDWSRNSQSRWNASRRWIFICGWLYLLHKDPLPILPVWHYSSSQENWMELRRKCASIEINIVSQFNLKTIEFIFWDERPSQDACCLLRPKKKDQRTGERRQKDKTRQ